MKKLQLTCRLVLLVVIALLGLQTEAYAEQLDNSVKECLENPEKCNETDATTDNNTMTNDQKTENVGLTIWDFFKMIFATIFVVVLLYFMLKFLNKKSNTYKSTQLVENLGGTSLGGNRSIQVVKVGGRLLVVGVGESIQLLKEIDQKDEYDQLISDYNNKMEQLVQPSDIVTKVMNKAKNSAYFQKNEGEAFQSVLKKQLDELSKGRKKVLDEIEKKGSDKNE